MSYSEHIPKGKLDGAEKEYRSSERAFLPLVAEALGVCTPLIGLFNKQVKIFQISIGLGYIA